MPTPTPNQTIDVIALLTVIVASVVGAVVLFVTILAWIAYELRNLIGRTR